MSNAEVTDSSEEPDSIEIQKVWHIESARLLIQRVLDIGRVSLNSAVEFKALSNTQIAHLELLSYGLTAEESALRLGVSVNTVKAHRKVIIKSQGARSQPHEVRLGFERGYLAPDPPEDNLRNVKLTPVELAVLDLASQGYRNQETAEIIGIGIESVKSHRKSVISKLGALNTTHAVRKAYEHRLLIFNLAPSISTGSKQPATEELLLRADKLLKLAISVSTNPPIIYDDYAGNQSS